MKYQVHWVYTRIGDSAGGDFVVDADSPEIAVEKLKEAVHAHQHQRNHPFDESLFKYHTPEPMVGDLKRSVVIEALKTLSEKELRELLDEVNTA